MGAEHAEPLAKLGICTAQAQTEPDQVVIKEYAGAGSFFAAKQMRCHADISVGHGRFGCSEGAFLNRQQGLPGGGGQLFAGSEREPSRAGRARGAALEQPIVDSRATVAESPYNFRRSWRSAQYADGNGRSCVQQTHSEVDIAPKGRP